MEKELNSKQRVMIFIDGSSHVENAYCLNKLIKNIKLPGIVGGHTWSILARNNRRALNF